MDVPIPTPRPDPPPVAPELAPAPAPAAPVPPVPAAHSASHSAQIALGVFLAVTLGVLAFRGYGTGVGARPTDPVASRPAVDLNRADRADLEQVPGIGPTLAREIDDHRRTRGPFRAVEELRSVKGVGPATLDKVRPFLRVDLPASDSPVAEPSLEPMVLQRKQPQPPAPAPHPRAGGASRKLQPGDPPVNVNTANLNELTRLPSIGPVTAQSILTARSAGPFKSLADLDRVKGIGPKTLDKIRPFVVFE